MTPFFAGSEPVTAHSGKYKGLSILEEEQDAVRAFFLGLTDEQRGEAFKDNVVLDYAGLLASELQPVQKKQLLDLIDEYVRNMDDGHAKVKMAEVATHLGETRFAWIGGSAPDNVFYYRIHSPVILIEFDHQLPAGLRHLAKGKRLSNPPVRAAFSMVEWRSGRARAGCTSQAPPEPCRSWGAGGLSMRPVG